MAVERQIDYSSCFCVFGRFVFVSDRRKRSGLLGGVVCALKLRRRRGRSKNLISNHAGHNGPIRHGAGSPGDRFPIIRITNIALGWLCFFLPPRRAPGARTMHSREALFFSIRIRWFRLVAIGKRRSCGFATLTCCQQQDMLRGRGTNRFLIGFCVCKTKRIVNVRRKVRASRSARVQVPATGGR